MIYQSWAEAWPYLHISKPLTIKYLLQPILVSYSHDQALLKPLRSLYYPSLATWGDALPPLPSPAVPASSAAVTLTLTLTLDKAERTIPGGQGSYLGTSYSTTLSHDNRLRSWRGKSLSSFSHAARESLRGKGGVCILLIRWIKQGKEKKKKTKSAQVLAHGKQNY